MSFNNRGQIVSNTKQGIVLTLKQKKCESNCKTCTWRELKQPQDGWCYMFEQEPEGICMQHELSPSLKKKMMDAVVDDLDSCT